MFGHIVQRCITVTKQSLLSHVDPVRGQLRLRISDKAIQVPIPLMSGNSTSYFLKLADLYAKDSSKAVQVQVNFGGCHGFQYDFTYKKYPTDSRDGIVDAKQQLL